MAVATAKTLVIPLKIELVGVSSLLALVPEQVEGLVIPVTDARRNNVYAGFYQSVSLYGRRLICHWQRFWEIAGFMDQPVTFCRRDCSVCGSRLKPLFLGYPFSRPYPDAAAAGRPGLTCQPSLFMILFPNYLKWVEVEENWLKTHQESSDSLHSAPMIEMRNGALTRRGRGLSQKSWNSSTWQSMRGQSLDRRPREEVPRSDVNSCMQAEDGEQLRLFFLAGDRL